MLSPTLLVPALAALATAVVTGVISYFVGRGMRNHDWTLALAREHMLERRQIYGRLLAEADRVMLSHMDGSKGRVADLERLFAENAVISLVATEDVVERARLICGCVLEEFAETPDRSQVYADAKRDFIAAAQAELASLERPMGRRWLKLRRSA